MFVYILIAVAHLRLRALQHEAPERLRVRMWGYPALTIVAIAAMLVIVAAMAFIPDQCMPLLFGIVSALGDARRLLATPAIRTSLRLVTVDGRAINHAALGSSSDRIVLGYAVVPEHDIAHLPTPTNRKLRACRARIQEVEQYPAFGRTKLVDMSGEPAVDEQPLAPGDRMGAHDRVVDGRVLGNRPLSAP